MEENIVQPRHSPGNKVVQYLRELSIVVIGVLITLMITGMVNSCSRQKELKGMLSLVKAELGANLELIGDVHAKWDREQRAFKKIFENSKDITVIPEDTMSMYGGLTGALYRFEFKKDSYEVLKNSILTQYVRKKGLLEELAATYRTMDNLESQLAQYSTHKTEALLPILRQLEPGESERWLNGTVYDEYLVPLAHKDFLNFLVIGPSVVAPGEFDWCTQSITKAISTLDRYGF